jgi:hypothetical protein
MIQKIFFKKYSFTSYKSYLRLTYCKSYMQLASHMGGMQFLQKDSFDIFFLDSQLPVLKKTT